MKAFRKLLKRFIKTNNNIECCNCKKPVNNKSKKRMSRKRRKELYSWMVRAKAVGIPLLPARRPTNKERREWEYKIVEAEMEALK